MCNFVDRCQRFPPTYAVDFFSKMWVFVYFNTSYHIAQGHNIHFRLPGTQIYFFSSFILVLFDFINPQNTVV